MTYRAQLVLLKAFVIAAMMTVLCMALTGCASGPTLPPPVAVARTVEVDVPVTTPCIKVADVPMMPPLVGTLLNGDARHDYDVVWPALVDTRAALAAALGLIKPCTITNP